MLVFSHICIDSLFYYVPPYFFMVVQDYNWCIGGSITHLTPSHAEKACSSINKLPGTMVSYFIPSTILVILANLESYWWFLCLLNFNYIEIISILLTDLPDQLQLFSLMNVSIPFFLPQAQLLRAQPTISNNKSINRDLYYDSSGDSLCDSNSDHP